MNKYAITGGLEGKNRLAILSRAMHEYTKNFISRAGVKKGDKVLDIGCGGGDVSFELADIVGDQGKVVAIDFDEKIIVLNQVDAQRRNKKNIQFKVGDVFNLSEINKYDFIYVRFLLSHLDNPVLALTNITKAAKVGGTIAIEDTQFSGHFSYPKCKAFEEYIKLYKNVLAKRKANADIGVQLTEMFTNAGLDDIHVQVVQPVFMYGEGKLISYITMDKIKESLKKEKLASEEEINKILQELLVFTENPNTILSLPRVFQVYGNKK